MSTPDSPLETLRRLHKLFGAWQHLQQVYANPSLDCAAREAAAVQALDRHAENLGVLNKCRQEYGCFPDVHDVFENIEEWATLGPADKRRFWDELALGMNRPDARPGDPWDRHSWGQQLDFWIAKCAGASETAAPASDARQGGGAAAPPLTPDPSGKAGGKMDTLETASAIRDFLLELDPKRRSDAYREAAREYMQWAAQIPRNEKATRQAWTRIYEQQRRGRGPLIGEKCPGRGWAWRTGSYRLRDGSHVAVEGWLPPAVVKRLDTPLRWPRHEPSSRLSLEVLLAALAVFHDLALPKTPLFMDYPEERPDAPGSFLWHLRRAFAEGVGIQSLDEPGIDTGGLQIAQSYLSHAKALLRAEKGGKRGLPLAGPEAPPPLTPDANPATAQPSGFLGAMDLAKKFNVPKKKMDLLHKRLERFRRKHENDSGYVIAVDTPGPRESRYLHAVEHVFPVIEDLAQRGRV